MATTSIKTTNIKVTPVLVKLKAELKDGKSKSRSFEEQMALKLLTMSNAKWKLNDDNYTFNGIDLKKRSK